MKLKLQWPRHAGLFVTKERPALIAVAFESTATGAHGKMTNTMDEYKATFLFNFATNLLHKTPEEAFKEVASWCVQPLDRSESA